MENPFLQTQIPPDWQAMKPADIVPGINAAIDGARENIVAIKNLDDSALTYENSVRALDRATADLNRAWTYVNHLQSVADSPELRKPLVEMMPVVSEFYSSIPLDEKLYAKIKAFSLSPDAKKLKGHKKRLLDETVLDFELNGANLPADKKKRLQEIEQKLALKTQKFSENVLDDTKRFKLHIENESDLDGLPQSAKDIAKKKAEADGKSGWVFTLEQPSYVPFITYADSDPLREKIWRASARLASDGEFSNWGLIREILQLRSEKAALLGRADFADMVLERRMARTGKTALDFVKDLREKFAAPFEKEWAALCDFAAESGSLENGKMVPWRAAYFSEKLRRKKYDFDPEELRPYFPMNEVKEGMFKICESLFGLKVKKSGRENRAWHPSVELYEVSDENGNLIGLFYTDFYPRESKRAGAWMNLLSPADGGVPALGVIAGNMSEPVDGRPALLSHDEVETLFHEFGHLLHFFMMDSPELGLRNVAWDFVELPSQIMENWTRDKRCLDIFAAHWKTGEKIPEELFEKFRRAQKFMGANAGMRQLSFADIDLAMHINPRRFLDAESIEDEAQKELRAFTHEYSEKIPSILPRFTHLFGDPVGYAAGYYSYKWAEVLDADAFTRFEAEGILNGEVGREFADKVLRVGNSIPPDEAFRNFMGRDPDSSALVSRSIGA